MIICPVNVRLTDNYKTLFNVVDKDDVNFKIPDLEVSIPRVFTSEDLLVAVVSILVLVPQIYTVIQTENSDNLSTWIMVLVVFLAIIAHFGTKLHKVFKARHVAKCLQSGDYKVIHAIIEDTFITNEVISSQSKNKKLTTCPRYFIVVNGVEIEVLDGLYERVTSSNDIVLFVVDDTIVGAIDIMPIVNSMR